MAALIVMTYDISLPTTQLLDFRAVPSPRGSLVGLATPNKVPSPQN